ncbi:hypothetical protein [Mycobacterium sp. 1164985.4]|uniref:hypothetical protein n=1 Tax=Mycobacterium sp. 1164985.4 TaxID=1834069 RepID=UPI0012EAE79F|nr:hypothetical protein [Mycobacterium sp. 1164985.4]
MDVTAVTVAELISVAGGWLCDRAMAGWTVTAWVPAPEYAQCLAILGVCVREAADSSLNGVDAPSVYGVSRCDTVGGLPGCVRHRVSVAARAFKAHALLAAGLQPNDAKLETFWLSTRSNTLTSSDFAHRTEALAP